MPGVSVVIPTWNGLDLLQGFLPSVFAACESFSSGTANSAQILIVDDASVDGTVEWLFSQGFRTAADVPSSQDSGGDRLRLDLIRNESNAGFGRSCNRGFSHAFHPLVLLLNNDVELSPEAIDRLARHFDDPKLFAVHCRVLDMDNGRLVGSGKLASFSRGFIRVHGSYVRSTGVEASSSETPLYSAFATGGAAMYDRSKFDLLRGFNDLLSPYYWEDVELSYRAWKRGYKVLYEPGATATHRISSTIGKLERRAVKIVQQRNRLVFHWVNLHDRLLLTSHLVWVLLLALTAPIRLQPGFIVSLIKAVLMLPRVLSRRKQERIAARLTDRQVFAVFDRLRADPGILAYDRYQELIDHGIPAGVPIIREHLNKGE